jgi:hypothetical protein
MKSIELKEATDRLKESLAVIVDNDELMYMNIFMNIFSENDEFLLMDWKEEVREYKLVFAAKDNQSVKVSNDGSLMYLVDNGGQKVQLTLLQPANYADTW